MDERRLRVGSLFEWVLATLAVGSLVWVISVPVQRIIGPRVEAALVDSANVLPPGVPAGATSVPLMLLLDGREIRQGDLRTRLTSLLPDSAAEGPAHVSTGDFGERHTRAYLVDGIRFLVVWERVERGGPMRVTGIYLP